MFKSVGTKVNALKSENATFVLVVTQMNEARSSRYSTLTQSSQHMRLNNRKVFLAICICSFCFILAAVYRKNSLDVALE